MKRILLIDDDEELCELVSEYIGVEGFEVSAVHDGAAGLESAVKGDFDAVVLDVMLPKMNGFDVLRSLRTKSTVPVLMLTARGEDTDRIVGLEIGADDYLPKPFNPRELVARLRAILRRTGNGADHKDPGTITVGDLVIQTSARSARIDGNELSLTSVEFEILQILAADAGNVVKKEDLVEKALDRRWSPFDRSLDMHISNIRKKIGSYSDGTDRIKTIRSVGYIYALPAN